MKRIKVLTVYGQRLSDSFDKSEHVLQLETKNNAGGAARTRHAEYIVETQATSGLYELDALLQKGAFGDGVDYLVLSNRKEMIWDGGIVRAVGEAIETFVRAGRDWAVLSCDGGALGQPFRYSAFIPDEQALSLDRQIRRVDCLTGAFIVIAVSEFQKAAKEQQHGAKLSLRSDYQSVSGGLAAYYVPSLYPCFSCGQGAFFREMTALHNAGNDHGDQFLSSLPHLTTAGNPLAEAKPVLVSVVIRTLFKRPHLLNRCLISIDYLAQSAKLECEVVLATDQPVGIWEPELLRLRKEFPGLTLFIASAEGRQGASRVRNLIAGIEATSGGRVAIIDDDDYFSTEAIAAFREASDSLFSATMLFDSQIIHEHWHLSGEGNWERHALRYGTRFKSSEWSLTISRHNTLPLCSVIHQGDFLRSAIGFFDFCFDLSEDFILHALLFSDVRMPQIVCRETVGAYQSHRIGPETDNVSTAEDRTEWNADTGAGVRDLVFRQRIDFTRYRQFAEFEISRSAIHHRPEQAPAGQVEEATAIADDVLRLLATASSRHHAGTVVARGHLGFVLKNEIRKLGLKTRKVKAQ